MFKSKKPQEPVKVLGRRSKEPIPQPTRRSGGLLVREQPAAWALFACYVAAAGLGLTGLVQTVRYFNAARLGTDPSGFILGLLVLVATLAWIGVAAYLASTLRSMIEAHRHHAIRARALFTFLGSLAGLVVLGVTVGSTVLASLQTGLAAVLLVVLALVSLITYAGNRSYSE